MRPPLPILAALLSVTLLAMGPSAAISAQDNQLISLRSDGSQGNDSSGYRGLAISADGRLVAFESEADNLVPGDQNGVSDIFVHDRVSKITTRVSVHSSGEEANAACERPLISRDGTVIVFGSEASNLVDGDNSGQHDIFVHDRTTGTTERVSVSSAGVEGNEGSYYAAVSLDGRIVAFDSIASNLVPNDTNEKTDVFLHDRLTGTTTRVSLDSAGEELTGSSAFPVLSADGVTLGFASDHDFVGSSPNSLWDAFAKNLETGVVTQLNVDSQERPMTDGYATLWGLSDDGMVAVMDAWGNALHQDDWNDVPDVFVRDRVTGVTELISVSTRGSAGNHFSTRPSISGDGRWVAFESRADNLVETDANDAYDIFVRDRRHQHTRIVTWAEDGTQADFHSQRPIITPDGRTLAYESRAANLVSGDANAERDVFVTDLEPLNLFADGSVVQTGDRVTLDVEFGAANGNVVLVVVSLDGTDLYHPIRHARFDLAGEWQLQLRVPSALQGMEAELQSWGFSSDGSVGESNRWTVTVQ